MTWFVYVLQSTKSKHFYIGSTNDKNRRLKEHNAGMNLFTRNKGPWIFVYSEEFETQSAARRRELEIKSYKGGNAFKKIVPR